MVSPLKDPLLNHICKVSFAFVLVYFLILNSISETWKFIKNEGLFHSWFWRHGSSRSGKGLLLPPYRRHHMVEMSVEVARRPTWKKQHSVYNNIVSVANSVPWKLYTVLRWQSILEGFTSMTQTLPSRPHFPTLFIRIVPQHEFQWR
jgi:hypothetical protein